MIDSDRLPNATRPGPNDTVLKINGDTLETVAPVVLTGASRSAFATFANTATEKGDALVARDAEAVASDTITLAPGDYNIGASVLSGVPRVIGSGADQTRIISSGTALAQRGSLLRLHGLTLQTSDSNDLRVDFEPAETSIGALPVQPKFDRTRIWGEYFDNVSQWTPFNSEVVLSTDSVNCTDSFANNYSVKMSSTGVFRPMTKTFASPQNLTDGNGDLGIMNFRLNVGSESPSTYTAASVRFGNGSPTTSGSVGQWMHFGMHIANGSPGFTNSQSSQPGQVDYAVDMKWAVEQLRYQSKGNIPVDWSAITWMAVYMSRTALGGTANTITMDRVIMLPRTTKAGMVVYCDDGSDRMLPMIRRLNANGIRVNIPVRLNHLGRYSTADADTIMSLDTLLKLQDAGNHISIQSYCVHNPSNDGYSFAAIEDDIILATKVARQLGFSGWHHYVPQQGMWNQPMMKRLRQKYVSGFRVSAMPTNYYSPTFLNSKYDSGALWGTPATGTNVSIALGFAQTYGGIACSYQHFDDAAFANSFIAAKAAGVESLTPDEIHDWYKT